MARKDRVPDPPRRSRGPQRRATPTDPAAAAKRRQTILLIAAGALAVAVAVVAIIFLTGGDVDERGALADAGCTLQSFPGLGSDHVALDAKPKWNSSPPTTGPHYELPAIWDFYDEPVPLIQSVHNLEHGGIVIHYGPDVPEAEVLKIREFYTDDPDGLLVSPLAANKDKITLSAWTQADEDVGTDEPGRGWLARCPRFDENAFSTFVEVHRYKGPERLEPGTLTPGQP